MPDSTKYASKLRGARVLVIGGSSGIGYAVAEACLEQGCSVIISSSSSTRIASAISELEKTYPSLAAAAAAAASSSSGSSSSSSAEKRLSGHACELADAATLEPNLIALLDAATDRGAKKLDHVVYTAGDQLQPSGVLAASVAKIQASGMVRSVAPQMLAKQLMPAAAAAGAAKGGESKYIKAGPASSLTMTTGAVSERPYPGWALQNMYATGMHGLTRGLALDMAPLRVNSVSPGAVETPLWSFLGEQEREGMMKRLAERSCTGKIASAEDVAEAYIYLLRDWNCTGSVVRTDSGSLLM